MMMFRYLFIFFLLSSSAVLNANERHSDPDGCFSCHALEGLQFIDEDGVLRVSSIVKSHYYSSLHGSVPCKDCHRKITNYPHEVENGYVDCSESCHVNEPSEGEAYTHKPIVEEFEKSAHGKGITKDFAGGNRLKEDLDEENINPSCRRCHSNTLYIAESQMDKFKEEFMHTDTECGTCHQGDVWRDQFGGHVLRRLVGSRWKKNDNNDMCLDCHGDTERMAKVKLEDPDSKEKHPVNYRWIHASESYTRSLHSRLLVTGVEGGASCIDCHAPTKMGEFRHDIRRDEDELSATHPDNLAKTCAQSSCHEFAVHSINAGFVNTDLHDIDQVKIRDWASLIDSDRLQSNWQRGFYLLGIFSIIFIGGCIFWLFKGINDKKQNAVIGDESFERIIIGRKGKKSSKRNTAKKKPAAARGKSDGAGGKPARTARTARKTAGDADKAVKKPATVKTDEIPKSESVAKKTENKQATGNVENKQAKPSSAASKTAGDTDKANKNQAPLKTEEASKPESTAKTPENQQATTDQQQLASDDAAAKSETKEKPAKGEDE